MVEGRGRIKEKNVERIKKSLILIKAEEKETKGKMFSVLLCLYQMLQ